MSTLFLTQLNSRSVNSKLGELKLMAYTKKPHVIAFSETWLNKCVPKFIGYNCEWKNRHDFGGGVGFLIKKEVLYQYLNIVPFPQGYLEFQGIKLVIDCGKEWN